MLAFWSEKQGDSGTVFKWRDIMAKRNIHTPGINLERSKGLGFSEIDKETGEHIDEGDRLGELAMRFLEDKEKLEAAISRVESSSVSEEDKAGMLRELNEAMDRLQAQYEADVEVEQERVQEAAEGTLGQMDQLMDELSEQADSIRDVTMDVADVDTSAAAEAAESKRQEVEQTKQEYAEKLRLQMEQAEMLAREMRMRHIRGQ
jgi:hypothetical protein